MKRLVLAVATLGVAVSVSAADDVEMKHSGEFRMRYHNMMDSTGVKDAKDSMAGLNHRFKWNVTARKGESLQAFLSLIHNGGWGHDAATGNPDGHTATPDGIGDSQNMVLVNRAWGWWKSTDMLSFKFGRFGIEIADGAVFAESDWGPIPTAHEGVMGAWDMDFAKVSFFGVKTDEFGNLPAAALTNDAERNLYGASLDFKNMPEAIKMANFHFVQEVQDEHAASPGGGARNTQRLGLTVGGDTMNLLYKATAAYVTGKEKDRVAAGANPSYDINSMMYDLMLGYSMPDTMGLKITAGFHSDTGDKTGTATKDESYDPFYYDGHNYAGLMDVVGWGNSTYMNFNVSMMATETLEAGVGYYMFSRTTNEDGVNFGDSYSTALGALALGTDKAIGSEIDVFVNKAYENGFKIGVRYSAFMPGKSLKDATPKTDQTMSDLFLQASLNF